MINSRVLLVVITMVFGLALSAEAGYKEDRAEARLRFTQRAKSSYALKGKSTITVPANLNRGSRLAARSAVGGSTTGNRRAVVATRLKFAQRSQSSLALKGRPSTLTNRPYDSGVLRASLRASPGSFRANRGSISRLR